MKIKVEARGTEIVITFGMGDKYPIEFHLNKMEARALATSLWEVTTYMEQQHHGHEHHVLTPVKYRDWDGWFCENCKVFIPKTGRE